MKKQDIGLVVGILILVSLIIILFAILALRRPVDAAEDVEEETTTEVVEKIIESTADSNVITEEPEAETTTEVVEKIIESTADSKVIVEEPEVDEPNTYPQLWTDEDAAILAQMLWGEARGVGDLELNDGRVISGDAQIAACIWTVLNRYDADFEDSIVEVVAAPNQFAGYKASNPVDEELLGLIYDVLDRWNREKHGETDVGRVLPSDYCWFVGDGKHNWFTNKWHGTDYWDWSLGDPYAWTME